VDLSNKALAVLLLVAIAISIGGTFLSISKIPGPTAPALTGHAADNATGQVNFTIQNSFSIRFVNANIPFGTGFVNSSNGCQMGTNNSPPSNDPDGCSGFNTTVHTLNLTIENDGNVAANVSLNFTANATGFIGGTSPFFKYRVNQSGEPGSCAAIMNGSAATFQEVGSAVGHNETTIPGAKICNNLNYQDSTDLIDVGFWISIPQNAASGDHNVVVTAIGCDDSSC